MSFKMPKARQLPSGNWRCEVSVDKNRMSFVRDTEEEAIKCALFFKLSNTNDQAVIQTISKQLTLRDAITAYIEDRSNVLSPVTIRGYECIRDYRFQKVMDQPLTKKIDWQKVVNEEAKEVKAKTLKNAWGLVKSVLENNHIACGKVRLPQVITEEHKFLTPDEIRAFLDAIRGDRHELAYLLCLHGLRRSEMLAVEKKDVDDEFIFVHGAMVPDSSGTLVLKDTNKNRTSRRKVPIMFDRLKELVNDAPDGLLVTKNPGTMFDHLNYICRINNLPEIGFHGLRHSYVSLCYHLKMPEAQMMEFGGYSDISVMRKIYTHIPSDDKKASIKLMRDFFDQ